MTAGIKLHRPEFGPVLPLQCDFKKIHLIENVLFIHKIEMIIVYIPFYRD